MNRIKISPLAKSPLDESPSNPNLPSALQLETGWSPDFSNSFDFSGQQSSLFVPLHYEKNYAYPLVVWLHSNGDDPSEINRVMPQLSLQNFVAVAPQAAMGDQHAGFYWEQDEASIDFAADAVIDAIEYAGMRTNTNNDRVIIAGYGDAGTMAFRVALMHPDLFAGVASINGPLPQGSAPLGRWSSSRNVEVFWAHCRHSEEFGQSELCRQLKLLHIAGFSVTLRQYPGGDELTAGSLEDLNRWIMQMSDSVIA